MEILSVKVRTRFSTAVVQQPCARARAHEVEGAAPSPTELAGKEEGEGGGRGRSPAEENERTRWPERGEAHDEHEEAGTWRSMWRSIWRCGRMPLARYAIWHDGGGSVLTCCSAPDARDDMEMTT